MVLNLKSKNTVGAKQYTKNISYTHRFKVSPYVFKQEIYRDDPWKMLIVCMMLNNTSYKQVDKVKNLFFEKFPNPKALLKATNEEVIAIIRPLGFYNKRCKTWKKFSEKWLLNDWAAVNELPGIGKYASDSWEIFQNENINIDVEDKELKKYIEWAKNQTV
jgi:methyl-CpG-binding domain protein 4